MKNCDIKTSQFTIFAENFKNLAFFFNLDRFVINIIKKYAYYILKYNILLIV